MPVYEGQEEVKKNELSNNKAMSDKIKKLLDLERNPVGEAKQEN